jgi:hypothetical protein
MIIHKITALNTATRHFHHMTTLACIMKLARLKSVQCHTEFKPPYHKLVTRLRIWFLPHGHLVYILFRLPVRIHTHRIRLIRQCLARNREVYVNRWSNCLHDAWLIYCSTRNGRTSRMIGEAPTRLRMYLSTTVQRPHVIMAFYEEVLVNQYAH